MARKQGIAVAAMLAASAVMAPTPAGATTIFETQITCPIGGETFTAWQIGSYTSFGSRPDGREYGTLPVKPLTECPGNGFVLFDRTFTPAELAALAPLVASAEYQAMRRSETPHYRAWWLASRIDRPAGNLARLLLAASWETDQQSERKARYQTAFAAAALALPVDPAQADAWFALRLRAANALRELGRFDDARAALDAIDRAELLPKEPEERQGAQDYIAALRALIAERNTTSEPANMIPRDLAVERCKQQTRTASEITACQKPIAADDSTEALAPAGDPVKRANDAARMAEAAAKEAKAMAAAAAAAYRSREAEHRRARRGERRRPQ